MNTIGTDFHAESAHHVTTCQHAEHNTSENGGNVKSADSSQVGTNTANTAVEEATDSVQTTLFNQVKSLLSKGIGLAKGFWDDGNATQKNTETNPQLVPKEAAVEVNLAVATESVPISNTEKKADFYEHMDDSSKLNEKAQIKIQQSGIHMNMEESHKAEETDKKVKTVLKLLNIIKKEKSNDGEDSLGNRYPENGIATQESYLLQSYNDDGEHAILGDNVKVGNYGGNITDGNFKTKA